MTGTPPIDWTAVGALAAAGSAILAVAAIFVTLGGIWIQNRATNLATALQLAWSLETRFQSGEFSQRRKKAAKALQYLTDCKRTQEAVEKVPQEIADVLNFFDTVGILTRKHAVDEQQIFTIFSGWLIPYWLVSEPIVKNNRTIDLSSWSEAEFLYTQFIRTKAKQQGRSVREQIVEEQSYTPIFLQAEIDHGGEGEPATAPMTNVSNR